MPFSRFVALAMVCLALTGCAGAPAPGNCGATGCDLRVSPGEPHPVLDHAELTIEEVTSDSALVTIGDDRREIAAGTTGEVAGFRVTVVSVEDELVRVLVAPGAG